MKTREEILAYKKAYREANKAKLAEKAKAYREANKDKRKVQMKAYRETNKEKEITNEFTKLKSELGESTAINSLILASFYEAKGLTVYAAENLENRSLEEFKALNAHVVLKFGRIKHPINQLPISSYEIHTEEEIEYLFADALTSISEDKALKRQLWTALQLLFNLSTGSK